MRKPTQYVSWGNVYFAVDDQDAIVGVILPLNDGLPKRPVMPLYEPHSAFKSLPINLMFNKVIEEETA